MALKMRQVAYEPGVRGRRTGIRIPKNATLDEYGMAAVEDFWSDEGEAEATTTTTTTTATNVYIEQPQHQQHEDEKEEQRVLSSSLRQVMSPPLVNTMPNTSPLVMSLSPSKSIRRVSIDVDTDVAVTSKSRSSAIVDVDVDVDADTDADAAVNVSSTPSKSILHMEANDNENVASLNLSPICRKSTSFDRINDRVVARKNDEENFEQSRNSSKSFNPLQYFKKKHTFGAKVVSSLSSSNEQKKPIVSDTTSSSKRMMIDHSNSKFSKRLCTTSKSQLNSDWNETDGSVGEDDRIAMGFPELTDGRTAVRVEGGRNLSEIQAQVAVAPEMVTFKSQENSSYSFAVLFKNTAMKTGLLDLAAGRSKAMRNVAKNSLVLYVLNGSAVLTCHRTQMWLSAGMSAHVPPFNNYALENMGTVDSKVLFLQVKHPSL